MADFDPQFLIDGLRRNQSEVEELHARMDKIDARFDRIEQRLTSVEGWINRIEQGSAGLLALTLAAPVPELS